MHRRSPKGNVKNKIDHMITNRLVLDMGDGSGLNFHSDVKEYMLSYGMLCYVMVC